ncbi:unnamed protein product [Schistocephalus solidus]|uniref:C2H2-type domain-containing protein n=1 Tax=Schistocephalus solidus TaxID=70667 RepID=A0A183SRD4_SCHSO|nr:unnamed protein product [Schistocephalus solidus]
MAILIRPRCQRTFRPRIGLVAHLRTQCTNNPPIPTSTSNSANPPSDSPLIPGIIFITSTTIKIKSQYSSPVSPKTVAATNTIRDGDSILSCPYCERTFTSRIGLVGNLRIHRTETGEPVPGAPTYNRDRRLHCPRAFTHRMGLFSHMRIHDSVIRRNSDNAYIPCTPSAPAILTATATPTTTNDVPPAYPDFFCPHCARNFNSGIRRVGHLRIHRTEAGEPVSGAPTYSRRARIQCPHCSRTITHHMGLLGHIIPILIICYLHHHHHHHQRWGLP